MEKLMQKVRREYFFYLFVFTLFFGVLLYNVTGFKGMDEIACVALLVFYGFFVFAEKKRKMNVGILVTLLIFLFYLFYSFYVAYNALNAITFDFLIQIRPYVAFFMVLEMAPSFSDSQKQLLKRLCLYIWPFFIPIGIYGLINPSFFNTIMDRQANYVSSIVCLSVVYLYCSDFTIKERFNFILMLSTGLIAVNSGFYRFFFLSVGILVYFQKPKKFNLRTCLAAFAVVALILYISKLQIAHYLFPSGAGNNANEFATRSVLYRTAVDILRDFFPLGSGFASFATDASGMYYSQIYSEYKLNAVNGLTPQNWLSVSDSYYPSLAQFGVIGILLYLFFWIYTFVQLLIRYKREREILPFVIVMLLVSFIFIENVSDSLFTSNKGFFMMVFLGLLLGKQTPRGRLATDRISGDEPLVPLAVPLVKETESRLPEDTRIEKPAPVEERIFAEKEIVSSPLFVYDMPPIPPSGKVEPAEDEFPENDPEEEFYDEAEDDELLEDEDNEETEDELPEEVDIDITEISDEDTAEILIPLAEESEEAEDEFPEEVDIEITEISDDDTAEILIPLAEESEEAEDELPEEVDIDITENSDDDTAETLIPLAEDSEEAEDEFPEEVDIDITEISDEDTAEILIPLEDESEEADIEIKEISDEDTAETLIPLEDESEEAEEAVPEEVEDNEHEMETLEDEKYGKDEMETKDVGLSFDDELPCNEPLLDNEDSAWEEELPEKKTDTAEVLPHAIDEADATEIEEPDEDEDRYEYII
ncbi:MAG: hypothetical protein LBT83_06005 [Tannerella sp.]|jgi:hypothetical protein|nr:hypothetical protein [Tannerella sp.]